MDKRTLHCEPANPQPLWIRLPIGLGCAALILTGILSACQPTPTKPAVINKNNGKLEAAIHATATPEDSTVSSDSTATTTSPEPTVKTLATWVPTGHQNIKFQGNDARVSIQVDADVLGPDMPIPVFTVRAKEITMDMVRKAEQALFEGNTAWEPKVGMTKGELQTEILKCQQFIGDWDKLVEYYGGGKDGEAAAKSTTKDFKKRIRDYQTQLATAPDTLERKPTDWSFHPRSYYTDMAVFGNVEGDDQQSQDVRDFYNLTQLIQMSTEIGAYHAMLEASNISTKTQESHGLAFMTGQTYTGDHVTPKWDDLLTVPMTMTAEQVSQQARTIASAMGLDNMAVVSVNAYPLLLSNGDLDRLATAGKTAPPTDENIPYGYTVYLGPLYQGLTTADALSNQRMLTAPVRKTNNVWYDGECMTITFANDRIRSLRWNCPNELVEVENSNVKLLDFDAVMASFQSQMRQQYTLDLLSGDDPANKGHKEFMATLDGSIITIQSIELRMTRMYVKDRPGLYRYIPVWYFTGKDTLHLKNGKTSAGMPTSRSGGRCFVRINALDGSVFDPSAGY